MASAAASASTGNTGLLAGESNGKSPIRNGADSTKSAPVATAPQPQSQPTAAPIGIGNGPNMAGLTTEQGNQKQRSKGILVHDAMMPFENLARSSVSAG